jgi:hypothetical protein
MYSEDYSLADWSDIYSCEKQKAGSLGQGQSANPEEGECPPLEAATKELLVKTVVTVIFIYWITQ